MARTAQRGVEDLAKLVAQRWRAKGHKTGAFPQVAAACLLESRPHEWLRGESVLDWCLRAAVLPVQASLERGFGDPPITLHWNERFYIDAYFWTFPKINVHDHGFNGAFTVLDGRSLHCRYDFPLAEKAAGRLRRGTLRLQDAELLSAGDVRPIVAGPEFIHEVWHLGWPTVSLVVRTHRDLASQFDYFKGGLAVDGLVRDPALIKKLGVLEHRRQLGHPRLDDDYKILIAASDPYAAYHLMSAYLDATGDAERRRAMLGRLERRHPRWLAPMLDAFRLSGLYGGIRWDAVKDEGERLMLAAMLSGVPRTTTLRLAGRSFPGTPPAILAHRWISGLSKTGAAGFTLSAAESASLLTVLEGGRAAKAAVKSLARHALLEPLLPL